MAEVWKRTFGPVQDKVPDNFRKSFMWGTDFWTGLTCFERAQKQKAILTFDLARTDFGRDDCCSCPSFGGHSCCYCGN